MGWIEIRFANGKPPTAAMQELNKMAAEEQSRKCTDSDDAVAECIDQHLGYQKGRDNV